MGSGIFYTENLSDITTQLPMGFLGKSKMRGHIAKVYNEHTGPVPDAFTLAVWLSNVVGNIWMSAFTNAYQCTEI